MNNLHDALDHIEKAIFLLGEDLVTLTVGQGLVSLPAVVLTKELLKLHDVVNHLGTFPPMTNNAIVKRIYARQAAVAKGKL